MNQDLVSFIWQQLPYRLPGMLVYFTGIGLSLAWMQRCRKPAFLVLIACTTMFALSIIGMILFYFMIQNQGQNIDDWWMIISVASSCIEAGAMAFLFWAAFAERQPYYPPEYFESGARDDYLRNP